jgi:hypothetical protein
MVTRGPPHHLLDLSYGKSFVLFFNLLEWKHRLAESWWQLYVFKERDSDKVQMLLELRAVCQRRDRNDF